MTAFVVFKYILAVGLGWALASILPFILLLGALFFICMVAVYLDRK